MKYISLPSGIIVNLEQVAFINAKDAMLHVAFPAMYAGQGAVRVMDLQLKIDDARALLEALEKVGVNTKQTLAELEKQKAESDATLAKFTSAEKARTA